MQFVEDFLYSNSNIYITFMIPHQIYIYQRNSIYFIHFFFCSLARSATNQTPHYNIDFVMIGKIMTLHHEFNNSQFSSLCASN